MMKRSLAFILLVVLLITACGSNDTPATAVPGASDPAGQLNNPFVTVFRAPT
jgi:major membrane immunogen (membrane-anchored lipoprotein)